VQRDFPDMDADEFVAWYWTVFSRSFPGSRNLAIVRDPRDVFISARRYFGFPDVAIWRSLGFIYRVLMYRRENFRIVVRYADAIADPVATMKSIAEAVDLPYHPAMPKAFDRLHVPVKGTMFGTEEDLAKRREAAFSHDAEREALVLDDAAKRTIAHYHEMLALFGLPGGE
jgi:hypothetical protein